MSTNGTFVNGTLVKKNHTKQLKSGDELTLLTVLPATSGTSQTTNGSNPDIVPRATHYPYLFQLLIEPTPSATQSPRPVFSPPQPRILNPSTSVMPRGLAQGAPAGQGLLRGTSLYQSGGLADYEEICELGRGSFATVIKVQHRSTGALYAMKVMDKRRLLRGAPGRVKEDLSEKVLLEARILKKVEHPGVIKFHEIFETDDELFLVMELVEGGELFDHLYNHGPFTEQDACNIMHQLLQVPCHTRPATLLCHTLLSR